MGPYGRYLTKDPWLCLQRGPTAAQGWGRAWGGSGCCGGFRGSLSSAGQQVPPPGLQRKGESVVWVLQLVAPKAPVTVSRGERVSGCGVPVHHCPGPWLLKAQCFARSTRATWWTGTQVSGRQEAPGGGVRSRLPEPKAAQACDPMPQDMPPGGLPCAPCPSRGCAEGQGQTGRPQLLGPPAQVRARLPAQLCDSPQAPFSPALGGGRTHSPTGLLPQEGWEDEGGGPALTEGRGSRRPGGPFTTKEHGVPSAGVAVSLSVDSWLCLE